MFSTSNKNLNSNQSTSLSYWLENSSIFAGQRTPDTAQGQLPTFKTKKQHKAQAKTK
jgi:hypothetical protein